MTNSVNINNTVKNLVVGNTNSIGSQPDKFLNYKLGLQGLSLFLVLYFYTYDIFQYCSKKPCFRFINISCKNIFFVILSLLVIFEIGYFAYILNELKFVNEKFPKYWWILAMFLTIYIMRMVHLSIIPIPIGENTDDFKAKPNSIISKKSRPRLLIVIIFIVAITLGLEIFSQYSTTKTIPNFKSLFNKQDLPLNIAAYSSLGSIPLLLILYSIHKNFSACKYNLPRNWND